MGFLLIINIILLFTTAYSAPAPQGKLHVFHSILQDFFCETPMSLFLAIEIELRSIILYNLTLGSDDVELIPPVIKNTDTENNTGFIPILVIKNTRIPPVFEDKFSFGSFFGDGKYK